jgi:hypothetical protein
VDVYQMKVCRGVLERGHPCSGLQLAGEFRLYLVTTSGAAQGAST